VVLAENEDALRRIGWTTIAEDQGVPGGNAVTIARYTGGGVIASVFGNTPDQMLPYLADDGWRPSIADDDNPIDEALMLHISGASIVHDPGYALFQTFINSVAFFLVALLGSQLAERLKEAGRELEEQRVDLRNLRTLHQDIVENIPSGIVTLDLEGRIVSYNQGAQRIIGLTAEEVRDKSWRDTPFREIKQLEGFFSTLIPTFGGLSREFDVPGQLDVRAPRARQPEQCLEPGLLEPGLRKYGVDMQPPPLPSLKTLNLGVKHSPEFACLPFKINLGNLMESLDNGANAILMPGGSGPCRFGLSMAMSAGPMRPGLSRRMSFGPTRPGLILKTL